MNTYTLCLGMVTRKSYKSTEDMNFKLDVFFAGDRITEAQYNELVTILATH